MFSILKDSIHLIGVGEKLGKLLQKFIFFYFNLLNPLSGNVKYTPHGKFHHLSVLDPYMTSRSSGTHAPGSGLISTDAPSPKIANFITNGWQLKF